MKQKWRQPLIWILKANLLVWAVDVVILAVLALLGFDVLILVGAGYFSKLLLLESGVIFLIGGVIAFGSGIFSSKVREHILHSGETWSVEKLSKGEKRANLFILTGVLLFLQSLLVSVFAL